MRGLPLLVLTLSMACAKSEAAEVSTERSPPSQPRREVDPRIGDLSDLRPEVRRAFEAHPEDFAPLPPPGPGDWLAVHPEESQTVGSFFVANPNRPGNDGRDTLYIAHACLMNGGTTPPSSTGRRCTCARSVCESST